MLDAPELDWPGYAVMRDAAACIETDGEEGLEVARKYYKDILLIEEKRARNPYGYDKAHKVKRETKRLRENPPPATPADEEGEEDAVDADAEIANELQAVTEEAMQVRIEKIIGTERSQRDGRRERRYLVKFAGYPAGDDDYFTRRQLRDDGYGRLVAAYDQEHGINRATEEAEEDEEGGGGMPTGMEMEVYCEGGAGGAAPTVLDVFLDGCCIMAKVQYAGGDPHAVPAASLEQDAGAKSGALIKFLIKTQMRHLAA